MTKYNFTTLCIKRILFSDSKSLSRGFRDGFPIPSKTSSKSASALHFEGAIAVPSTLYFEGAIAVPSTIYFEGAIAIPSTPEGSGEDAQRERKRKRKIKSSSSNSTTLYFKG